MMHPDTELREVCPEIGLGVFATRRIPRGTVVWIQDELDLRLSLDRVRSLSLCQRRLLDRYGFLDSHGDRILCWDLGRFVNHACDPNVLPTPWRMEVAARTIHEGEQLTNDYATLNLERGFRCLCGAASCRGRVRPNDFERLVGSWDERMQAALTEASRVVQPLVSLLDGERRRHFRRFARRPDLAPSIASNRLEAARTDPLAFAAVPRRTSRPRGRARGGPEPASASMSAENV